jgi:hypothetical protein
VCRELGDLATSNRTSGRGLRNSSAELCVEKSISAPRMVATELNHQQGRSHISAREAENPLIRSDTINHDAQARLMGGLPIELVRDEGL